MKPIPMEQALVADTHLDFSDPQICNCQINWICFEGWSLYHVQMIVFREEISCGVVDTHWLRSLNRIDVPYSATDVIG